MKILPASAAGILGQRGFPADTCGDEGLLGAPDEMVAAAARREGRVLVTLDRDFSDIRAYPPNDHAGIVVLRPQSQDKHSVEELLQRLLAVLDRDSPAGELWIVEPDRLRRRS